MLDIQTPQMHFFMVPGLGSDCVMDIVGGKGAGRPATTSVWSRRLTCGSSRPMGLEHPIVAEGRVAAG